MFIFLGILISKQIAPANLFSFQSRIKTLFHTEVKCKVNTQITNIEETKKGHRVIRLLFMHQLFWPDMIHSFLGVCIFELGICRWNKLAQTNTVWVRVTSISHRYLWQEMSNVESLWIASLFRRSWSINSFLSR